MPLWVCYIFKILYVVANALDRGDVITISTSGTITFLLA